jgi:hypothetical protein
VGRELAGLLATADAAPDVAVDPTPAHEASAHAATRRTDARSAALHAPATRRQRNGRVRLIPGVRSTSGIGAIGGILPDRMIIGIRNSMLSSFTDSRTPEDPKWIMRRLRNERRNPSAATAGGLSLAFNPS